MTEYTDAQRLQHIADEPEMLRFLYDMFGERGLKFGHDSLTVIRELIDEDMDKKANHRGAFAEQVR